MKDLVQSFATDTIKDAAISWGKIAFADFEDFFRIENIIKSATGLNFDYQKIYYFIGSIAIGIAILLFLKKGFEIYIIWNSGDSDLDPFVYLSSFFKIIFVIVFFNTMYNWGIEILLYIQKNTDKIMTLSHVNDDFFAIYKINNILQISPFWGLLFLIMSLVNGFRIKLQYFKRAFELLILRMGVPLAGLDFLNADSVAWRNYSKKIFQIAITLYLQMFLFTLSTKVTITGVITMLFALSIQLMALNLPGFFSDILVAGAGSGGLMSKIGQGASTARSIIGIFRR